MADAYCILRVCFVPLNEPSPGIFGLQQFIPGLALMAVAWTTADPRYRFRVASAALRVRQITFIVLASVGILTLLTSLWHAQHWLVPRGNLLSPALWQTLLGFAFIGTFLLWTWVAFYSPPVFSARNAQHFTRAFLDAVLRGGNALPEIVYELGRSIPSVVRFATNLEDHRRQKDLDPQYKYQPSDVEQCANVILLLLGERRVCKALIESSPHTAIVLFEEASRAKKFSMRLHALGKNLIGEGLRDKNSFLFTETDDHNLGFLGYEKPLTHAMFSDFALVEGVGSFLDLDWKQARSLDPEQWEAYCRVVLMAFSAYVDNRAPAGSAVIYRALEEMKHAASDLRSLDGAKDWDRPVLDKLRVVVKLIQDALETLDRLGQPEDVSRRFRRRGDHTIYDWLADLIFDLIWDAAAVRSPRDLCWWVQHNSVWSEFFGYDTNGPASQIVKRKLMGQIYGEINQMKKFPNYKGARYLGFCLNVLGLTLNRQAGYEDSVPLQRAVLRWTKKNFALLRQRQPGVAENCLVEGFSFDEEHTRIVRTDPVEGLRREPHYAYLPVDPAPTDPPPFEGE